MERPNGMYPLLPSAALPQKWCPFAGSVPSLKGRRDVAICKREGGWWAGRCAEQPCVVSVTSPAGCGSEAAHIRATARFICLLRQQGASFSLYCTHEKNSNQARREPPCSKKRKAVSCCRAPPLPGRRQGDRSRGITASHVVHGWKR